MTLPVIDAHALLGEENHLELQAPELLRRMDANGVEIALARPMGAELAADFAAGNDRVLKASPRILGWATANPWFGARALDELRRCRDLRAAGLFLHPSRQGFFPTEPVAAPVVELAVSFGWPVMFHTGTFLYSDILAVVEVARRHPSTPFVAGFGGFSDMWFELPGVIGEVPNLHLDASMMWGDAIRGVVERHGADRVLYGSAEPRNRYEVNLKAIARLGLGAERERAILRDNARRLFKLP
jgi:predicted TIM-barrel fold metal-dependent hydrolase